MEIKLLEEQKKIGEFWTNKKMGINLFLNISSIWG